MKIGHLQWWRTSSYFFGAIFFLSLGYWLKNNIIIFNDKVVISWQESTYLSIAFPIWGVNVTAAVLFLYTLLLILPNFQVLQQRARNAVIFTIVLGTCVLPLHAIINTPRLNAVDILINGYSLILYSIGIALCFRGLLGMPPTRIHTIGSRLIRWVRNISTRTFLIGSVAGVALICSVISLFLFDGVPGSYDGCMYLFQARLFSHGMLSAQIPPEPQFFENTLAILSDKWYTQFPPGFPAVLTLGVLLRIPWIVNPLLGALTIGGIYLIANELYGKNIAKLSALLACTSSFFLFMSSEFMAHTSTLFFITTAFLSFVWMVKKKRPLLSSIVCGTSLGIALLCRPYTTTWVGVSMVIAAIMMRKQLSIRHILIGAIPLIAAGVAFLAYNAATTGHPLILGYIALNGKEHYPGFHQDPWMEQPHTIAQGVKYLLGNLNGLNYHLFEWPMPSLFFVVLYLAFGKKETWDWILVGWIGSLLVGHVFYFFNEFHFGPRFVYETLPAYILLTSKGISLSTQFLAAWHETPSYAHARSTICFILTGLFLFAMIFNIPATAKSYHDYGEDVTIQKYLKKHNFEKALVFVKDIRTYEVHYPFNAPFANPHIYARYRKNENRKLAEKFPDYRYFIADEKDVVEVSINEL